jgi:hypothetical protein
MILGRPTNLWTGLVVSALAVIQIVLVNIAGLDAVVVSTLLGAIGILLGSLISLVANQPPTVNSGDKVNVVTPPGEENMTVTV